MAEPELSDHDDRELEYGARGVRVVCSRVAPLVMDALRGLTDAAGARWGSCL